MQKVMLWATVLLMLFTIGEARAQGRTGFAVNVGVGLSQVKDRDGGESFNANDFGIILGAEYRFNEYFALGRGTFQLGSPEDDFKGL